MAVLQRVAGTGGVIADLLKDQVVPHIQLGDNPVSLGHPSSTSSSGKNNLLVNSIVSLVGAERKLSTNNRKIGSTRYRAPEKVEIGSVPQPKFRAVMFLAGLVGIRRAWH